VACYTIPCRLSSIVPGLIIDFARSGKALPTFIDLLEDTKWVSSHDGLLALRAVAQPKWMDGLACFDHCADPSNCENAKWALSSPSEGTKTESSTECSGPTGPRN
jgi:hypothetical protein